MYMCVAILSKVYKLYSLNIKCATKYNQSISNYKWLALESKLNIKSWLQKITPSVPDAKLTE